MASQSPGAFDIFQGIFEGDCVWLECVHGFAEACDRMNEIAAAKPGLYFVFGGERRQVLAKVDTTKFSKQEPNTTSGSASNIA